MKEFRYYLEAECSGFDDKFHVALRRLDVVQSDEEIGRGQRTPSTHHAVKNFFHYWSRKRNQPGKILNDLRGKMYG